MLDSGRVYSLYSVVKNCQVSGRTIDQMIRIRLIGDDDDDDDDDDEYDQHNMQSTVSICWNRFSHATSCLWQTNGYIDL